MSNLQNEIVHVSTTQMVSTPQDYPYNNYCNHLLKYDANQQASPLSTTNQGNKAQDKSYRILGLQMTASNGDVPLETETDSDDDMVVEKYNSFTLSPHFDAAQFKVHFRITPDTFEFLLDQIGKSLERDCSAEGELMMSADKQLLLALWQYATTESVAQVADRFGVSHSHALSIVHIVSSNLNDIAGDYIVWPWQPDAADEIANGFVHSSGFPATIGALADAHIAVVASPKLSDLCRDHYGNHSIHLQAACDSRFVFTHCSVGHFGSSDVHHVLRDSALGGYLDDDRYFPNDTHIIGDDVYTLHPRLLTPYDDKYVLNDAQENYNACHAAAMMTIKQALCLLKARWKSLSMKLRMWTMEFVSEYVMACCVLHNICILMRDEVELDACETLEMGVTQEVEEYIQQTAIDRRDMIGDFINSQKRLETSEKHCILPRCKSSTSNRTVSYHKPPSEYLKAWAKVLLISEEMLSQNDAYICSDHFLPSDLVNNGKNIYVKYGSLPTKDLLTAIDAICIEKTTQMINWLHSYCPNPHALASSSGNDNHSPPDDRMEIIDVDADM